MSSLVRSNPIPSLLAAVALLALAPADVRAAPTGPFNRELKALSVMPVAGEPSKFLTTALWGVSLHTATTAPLDLSTEVALMVNGHEVGSQLVKIAVAPGAGSCGACTPSCGQGAINGLAASLLCISNGAAGGCSCQFPPLTAEFHLPSSVKPGDEITVILLPAPGALVDQDGSDDFKSAKFGPPIFWDRKILGATKQPTPGAPEGTYDIQVRWAAGAAGMAGQSLVLTPTFTVYAGDTTPWDYDSPCGPWILAPGACPPSLCDNQICATIICGSGYQSVSRCQHWDLGWIEACGCFSEDQYVVIPGVKLKAGEPVSIVMKGAKGALPELPALDVDAIDVCNDPATAQQYGSGKAGSKGVPVLASLAPPVLGGAAKIEISKALPGAAPILVLGTSSAALKLDGGVLLVAPLVVAPLPVKIGADGTLALGGPLGTDPGLCGFGIFLQALIPDPGAAGVHHLAMTNGLKLVLGT